MRNGLAIIEQTETETKGFYIDQDALECARLNAKVNKRLDAAAKNRLDAERKRRRAEGIKAKRKAYIASAIRVVLYRATVCGAMVWAGAAGMIHPAIAIPVSVGLLCAACLRLGVLLGKAGR